MLNYVWLGLILLGLGTALSYDLYDNFSDKYKNGKELSCIVELNNSDLKSQQTDAKIIVSKKNFSKLYNKPLKNELILNTNISYSPKAKTHSFLLFTNDSSPAVWKKIAENSGDKNDITGSIRFIKKIDTLTYSAFIKLEEVSFLKMREITNSALNFANTSVEIVLGLIGIMALWLGIMKIAEESGVINYIATATKPLMKFLFPEIPSNHPAVGAIIMNLSATFLGLGNAATPFGIKAMEELNKLNEKKDTATNAMCMFLVLNTASFALMPATAIALRAASGSAEPAIIIGTTMFGSFCATIAGVFFVKLFEKFPLRYTELIKWIKASTRFFIGLFILLAIISLLYFSGSFSYISKYVNGETLKSLIQIISTLAIPFIIAAFVIFGAIKKVKIYETFIEGAKEGFQVAVKIIPYLVAILVGIAIFRTGGAMDWLIFVISPITNLIGMPAEVVPMALMRPLSGSGSLGIMAEIMKVHGPDSFIGILVSTMFGSTETTFFVLAVYFGAVNIKKTRYALAAGLLSDFMGFVAAIFIVRLLFGN